jgi:ribokinase
MSRILVVGSSNTDMVVQVDHLPAAGETVLGRKFTMAAGGKGANQAVAAARLGAEVTLVARIGEDRLGEQALGMLREDGIGCRYIRKDPEAASGVALIFVDDEGENSIAVAPGANACLSPEDVDCARQAIEKAEVLLLQLEIPLETVKRAAQLAHQAGSAVILNPAPVSSLPLPASLLGKVDFLTPNVAEAAQLAGIEITSLADASSAANILVERGIENVIITLGDQGALISTSEGQKVVPGFSVQAVDTTAAGDAFNGALAVALAQGLGLVEAVRFANACGALASLRLGAQPSLPTRDQVESFLAGRT